MSETQDSPFAHREIAETPAQRLGRQLAQLREISAIAMHRLRAAAEEAALIPPEEEEILDDDAPEPCNRRAARTAIVTYGKIVHHCIAQEQRLTASLRPQPNETACPPRAPIQ